MSMQRHATAWDNELERRIRAYEDLERQHGDTGRLSAVDYGAMVVLLVGLVGAFWIWGGV